MKDSTKNNVRFMVLSAMFIALGVVLPIAFHTVPNAGATFLPMFIPVLLGALFLPWQFALAVGIITPLLSSLLTGMPPMAPRPMFLMMAAELGVASVVLSLMKNIKLLQKRKYFIDLALVPALVLGKIANLAVLLISIPILGLPKVGMWAYISGSFATGIPGIIILAVLLPLIYSLIKRRQAA